MKEIKLLIENAKKLSQSGHLEQALALFMDEISECEESQVEDAAEIKFQLAYFLFEERCYDNAVIVWKDLLENGYRTKDTVSIVEEAFLAPNDKEFEAFYQKNCLKYQMQIMVEKKWAYKDLPYRFIPVADHIYYVYDFENKRILQKLELGPSQEEEASDKENLYDSVLLWDSWDYGLPIQIKKREQNQSIYFLSKIPSHLCYLQLPEFDGLFHASWYMFDAAKTLQEFFHIHTEIPLPRLYGGSEERFPIYQDWIQQAHEYRCTKEGRNNNRVLLTFGIPSFNRGHRALKNVKHMQNLFFDSEVEFLVVDNCSIENVEGYQELERLAESDSRITYYRFPENPGENNSTYEVLNRAAGTFCCLLSDEDFIYLDNVYYYLQLLRKYEETVGFVCGAGAVYYEDNEEQIFSKGEEAFVRIMWRLNYLSGLIFKTSMFHDLNMYQWLVERRESNPFVYAYGHNALAMRFSFERDIYMCGINLFREGKDEGTVHMKELDGTGQNILSYATYEQRRLQFQGCIQLFNEWKERVSIRFLQKCYLLVLKKVMNLFYVHKKVSGNIDIGFQEAADNILAYAIEEIYRLGIPISNEELYAIITAMIDIHAEFSELLAP
ncbi:MAG: glycosyltransferase family 2 protein [Lachnospiraceae bacterium]|nr:glycosyltransferase family 2 protein [Lachnospiraceae bacterium]